MEFRFSTKLVPYEDAVVHMEERVGGIVANQAEELIWFLEHPPIYTMGTGTREGDVLGYGDIPMVSTGRGGRSTYHGPGQRVVYIMLDLNKRGPDLRGYVQTLEKWLVDVLAQLGIVGHLDPENVGVWVKTPGEQDKKIAALGIRVRKWITYHGIALNVAPNLEHFSGIIPCGIQGKGVTSLVDQGIFAPMDQVDRVLKDTFCQYFRPS